MASYQYVYHMSGVTKAYPGGKKVLENINLNFLPDAKIGVLGPNGAGKSTLMRLMAGIDKEFNGEAWSADGAKVGYLSQEPELDEKKTVQENVLEGMGELVELVQEFNDVSMKFGEVTDDDEMNALIERQAELQEKIDAADAWDLERKAEIAMDALRCPPGDWPVTKLSGGERRRVALCRLLLSKPDMLLLDEPTNHLDAETVAWLERTLQEYEGCVVIATFSITSLAGFWNSIAAVGFLMRGITPPIWRKRPSVCSRKPGKKRPVSGPCPPSLNGSVNRPRPAKQNPRRVSMPMRS